MFKIISRVKSRGINLGYQLMSDDGKLVTLKREDVLRLADTGQIINAGCNKNRLYGKDTDLRTLPIHYINNEKLEVDCNKILQCSHNRILSRHERAKRFLEKQSILGEKFKLKLKDDDHVELIEVIDKSSTGTLIIPSFITDFYLEPINTSGSIYEGFYFGPLKNCKFTKVLWDNPNDISLDISWFCCCMASKSLEIGIKHPDKITGGEGIFALCSNLIELKFLKFSTYTLTNFRSMFYGCRNLSNIDASFFDTSKITDMSNMFYGCHNLNKIDLKKFNTKQVTNMSCMFSGCDSLTELDIGSFNTESVTDMHKMFCGCARLTELSLSGFNTALVTDMSSMFSGCKNARSINLSGINTDKVIDMSGMFQSCASLENIDISSFNTLQVKRLDHMFEGCRNLEYLDLSHFSTKSCESMSGMFKGCRYLKEINVSNFNTELVWNFNDMFGLCESIEKLDLSSFRSNNLKTMQNMFRDCTSLREIDLRNIKPTKYVVNTYEILSGCVSLESIYISYRLYNMLEHRLCKTNGIYMNNFDIVHLV